MNSNDLFSFLDEAPPEIDDDETQNAMDTDNHAEVPKKRKIDEDGMDANDAQIHANGNSRAGPSEPKKPRMASPAPMVTDEVEIEAKREVAASAGLQGSVEAGSRLELRHQVRTSIRTNYCPNINHSQVRHQVAVPPGYPYVPIANHVPPAEPAREYKFTLDPFQQVSVHAIQRNESVLVSAHTSAGKTVVAEYAIAHCLQNKQRVIYTSPIKASCQLCAFVNKVITENTYTGFE